MIYGQSNIILASASAKFTTPLPFTRHKKKKNQLSKNLIKYQDLKYQLKLFFEIIFYKQYQLNLKYLYFVMTQETLDLPLINPNMMFHVIRFSHFIWVRSY